MTFYKPENGYEIFSKLDLSFEREFRSEMGRGKLEEEEEDGEGYRGVLVNENSRMFSIFGEIGSVPIDP